MGSVKDLEILEAPTDFGTGIGRFIFSDRYSVFDWGEMPDHIPEKGKAICLTTSYFFEQLESLGIKTHYIGIVENGVARKLSEISLPSNTMEFKMVRVIKPSSDGITYNYELFKSLKSNFLIPLEVIYRNSLPSGSSLLKRLQSGEAKPEDFGLDYIPQPDTKLSRPVLDFSTKLEITDRYLKENEAMEISGLNGEEFSKLKSIAFFLNGIISQKANTLGLYNEDGKFEFAMDEQRNLMAVDAVGTLDECRFTYEGVPFSKEIMRIFYRNTPWYQEVEKAKREDRINWKKLVSQSPPALPPEWKNLVSDIYKSYANEVTGVKFFETKPLKEVLNQLKHILN